MCRRDMLSVWMFVLVVAVTPLARASGSGEETVSLFGGGPATVVWTLIIFLVLVVVLGRFAWKPLLEGLKNREDMIRTEIDNARQEREQAEQALKTYRDRLAQAEADAEKLIKQSAVEAERVRSEILARAQVQAREAMEQAGSQMELARQDVLREIYVRSTDLASDLAARIIEREVNSEDHRILIDTALDELQARTNGG